MSILDPSILAELRRQRLVREGHFALAAGRHSAALLDRDHLTTEPTAVEHMSYAIAKRFFTDHVDTVASPSIQGAGLAVWVAHFLDPKARVVGAEQGPEGPAVPPALVDLIHDRRVLLVDDLIITGDHMRPLVASVDARGGEIIGIAALWNLGAPEIDGRPVFGLLNTVYEAYPPGQCPLCAAGVPLTDAGH